MTRFSYKIPKSPQHCMLFFKMQGQKWIKRFFATIFHSECAIIFIFLLERITWKRRNNIHVHDCWCYGWQIWRPLYSFTGWSAKRNCLVIRMSMCFTYNPWNMLKFRYNPVLGWNTMSFVWHFFERQYCILLYPDNVRSEFCVYYMYTHLQWNIFRPETSLLLTNVVENVNAHCINI